MQNDSPIPMADDQDENKQTQSNAIELHDTGLESVYKAILKQDANKMKSIFNQIEEERKAAKDQAWDAFEGDTKNEQKDE
jgi:hypothetical protein